MSCTIHRATLADLEQLAPLFDAYRRFYQQPGDLALAREFLRARITADESVLLLAADAAGHALGFVQMYPLFSSVRALRTLLLNDLFVAEGARRHGVARALLDAAAAFGRAAGVARLELETMPDNHAAQALYRRMGWQAYDASLRFRLPLG